MRGGIVVGLVLIGFVSCKSVPMDPFARAERAVEDGKLLVALEVLDLVPPANPNYPQARTLAQAVERRMRAGQEMLLRGLLLRTEWRDEEAIRYFEFANQIWPTILGAENLVRATRNRMKSLDQVGPDSTQPGNVANTLPVPEDGRDPADGAEVLTTGPPAVPGPETVSPTVGDSSRSP